MPVIIDGLRSTAVYDEAGCYRYRQSFIFYYARDNKRYTIDLFLNIGGEHICPYPTYENRAEGGDGKQFRWNNVVRLCF